MEKEVIEAYVDNALEYTKKLDLMRVPNPNMPEEMVDKEGVFENDWVPWKPIKSTVSENDLEEIEKLVKHKLPSSFKHLLKYKHFYNLYTPQLEEISFFKHPIRDWKREYKEYYSYDWVKENLIDKNFIPFADHFDWGILCFNANEKVEDNEYPIIMVDHELVFDEPMPFENFAKNFIDLLKARI